MPTLKSTDCNREGTKHLSTIHNLVCVTQLNQEVFKVLEECQQAKTQIDRPIVYNNFDILLNKLQGLNNTIINKISALTTDLNCKTRVKRFVQEEIAVSNKKRHLTTVSSLCLRNQKKN